MAPVRATPSGEDGLSLVEMLVVLAIIALSTTIAMHYLAASSKPDLRAVSSQVYSLVRRARVAAVTSGDGIVLSYDASAHQLSFRRHQRVDSVTLPETIGVEFLIAGEVLDDDDQARMTFDRDGSSSGGEIRLSFADQRRSIVVSWLTGLPTVRTGDETP